MIKRKKKICKKCNRSDFIFGRGLCSTCYRSAQKPVKKISERHKKTLAEYSPKRKEFLSTRPYCELRLRSCTYRAEVVHHTKGKATPELYLDSDYWMASCSNCNLEVERIGAEAYERGLKIKHNEK